MIDEQGNAAKGTVYQQHDGSGDNVQEKHVHHAVSLAALLDPVQDVLTCLRHRDARTAKDKLAALQATSQLDSHAKGVLDLVAILADVANANANANANATVSETGYVKAERLLHSEPEGIVVDIARAVQLRLDILHDRRADAQARYDAFDNPGEFCQEVYFEFLASRPTLEAQWVHNSHVLSEATLCGLVRGFLRLEQYQFATAASHKLRTTYQCFNSRVIDLIARTCRFSEHETPSHYWLITSSIRNQLLTLVDEAVYLIQECCGEDDRILRQSVNFLRYMEGDHDSLVEACWKYISRIENIDESVAEHLRSMRERNPKGVVGLPFEINKARNDVSYRKHLIKQLSAKIEISTEDLFLFERIAERAEIKSWLDKGGKVATESDFDRDFVAIELRCYSSDGSASARVGIKRAVDVFVVSHKAALNQTNPRRLLELSNMLQDLDLSTQACSLLQPVIPEANCWLSPIVRSYTRALVESHQLTTLNNIISSFHQSDWCEFIWHVKARQLDYINDLPSAIDAMESAVSLSPHNLSTWHYLISLHKRHGTSNDVLIETLNRIPDEILTASSELSWQVLYESLVNGGFHRAESMAVTWFIQDPLKCAKSVTDLHLNGMSRSAAGSTPSLTTEHCLGGFVYVVEGRSTTKLVVENMDVKHACLVLSSSPLGKLLLGMDVGATAQHGMHELQLVEKLPPYVAIFRLAVELREEGNDGSDCFYSISLPDDPDEMIANLEKKMRVIENPGEKNICSDPKCPLFMKGHMLGDSCPVHSALRHLTSKESVKLPLPNLGARKFDALIFDVYSIIYLGLTGLIHGLVTSDTKIVVTVETQAYLKGFISDISREDYLRIGLGGDGKLFRTTSEDIRKQTQDIQLAVTYVLKAAHILKPKLVDMPPDIVQMQDSVDMSVYSSLKLSISNDIHWLCIDAMFAQVSHSSGYAIADAQSFILKLASGLGIKEKLPALYSHAAIGLPYPLTFEDLLQMAGVDDEYAHYFLAEILKMYPRAYSDTQTAVDYLGRVAILVLAKAYLDGEILCGLTVDNPRNNGYAERVFNVCCYISMQFEDGDEAERKLSLLLYVILDRFAHMPKMRNLIRRLGSRFIAGHFLSFDVVNSHLRDISSG